MNIKNNITQFSKKLPPGVTLVAVSKMQPIENLKEAYEAGQRIFGENKVQEMREKFSLLPPDIQWHMIGHVQTNKVKYIIPFVHLIHSVDSIKLLLEIEKQATKNNRIISCLLQVHIAEEDSKFGFDEKDIRELITFPLWKDLKHIKIKGLMGMATFTPQQDQIRKEFRKLKTLFDELKEQTLPLQVQMEELSMGMTGDYRIALEEGSTMIRIGTALFGIRDDLGPK